MIRRSVVALFAAPVVCFALAAGIAHGSGVAQTDADSALIVDPDQLTITVPDGCSRAMSLAPPQGCSQERRLLLRATQEITGVVAITNDLRRTDDAAVLPAGTITVSSTDSLEADGFGTLDVKIDLSRAPAGEYQGAIILDHSAGATRLPISVRTRDHWLMPLLVLLGALAVGGGLSLYRELRKRPDELRDQLARLKLQVDADSQLLDTFDSALTQRIEAAHQALERDKLDDAETQITEAEQCLRRWQQARSDWLKLSERIADEEQSAGSLPMQLADESNLYRSSLLERLQELHQTLPKAETPQDANATLKTIAEATNWQRQLSADLEDADSERTRLAEAMQSTSDLLSELSHLADDVISATDREEVVAIQALLAPLQARADGLASSESLPRRMARLSSENVEARQVLRADVDALLSSIQAIRAELGPLNERADLLMDRYQLSRQSSFVLGGVAPEALPQPPATDLSPLSNAIVKAGQQARWRLLIYQAVTIIVAAVLVIPLGMNQLYAANATFGANPLFDYPALLFWGIGLESSRESVVALARTMMRGEKE